MFSMACSSGKSTWTSPILSRQNWPRGFVRSQLFLDDIGIDRVLVVAEVLGLENQPSWCYCFCWLLKRKKVLLTIRWILGSPTTSLGMELNMLSLISHTLGEGTKGISMGAIAETLWIMLYSIAYIYFQVHVEPITSFIKKVVSMCMLNPWSKEECEKFVKAIKFDDEDEWMQKFNLVGGKPRFLFFFSNMYLMIVRSTRSSIYISWYILKRVCFVFTRSYFSFSSLVVAVIMNVRNNHRSAVAIRSIYIRGKFAVIGKEIEKFLMRSNLIGSFLEIIPLVKKRRRLYWIILTHFWTFWQDSGACWHLL